MTLHRKEPGKTGSDWVLPLVGLIFASYYLYSIRELAWEAKVSAVCVAVVLVILSVIFLIRSAVGLKRGSLTWSFHEFFDDGVVLRMRVMLFALAIGYILVIPYLGFTLTTFVFLCITLRLIGHMAWVPTVLWSGLLALVGWALFIAALGTGFPRGPFETAMHGLLGL